MPEKGIDIVPRQELLTFKEMYRILKPNGILITSADYYESKIDTKNQMAYGVPIRIFSKNEVISALDLATNVGFKLNSPIDFTCQDKVVRWEKFDLEYTYVLFCLHKGDG